MNNKKHILALALSIATTVVATIQHDEVTSQNSTLIEQSQASEKNETTDTEKALAATVIKEKADTQSLVNDEEKTQSDLQAETTKINETLKDNAEQASPLADEVTIVTLEQAQTILDNTATNLVDGSTFEFDGKKYIIKTIVTPATNVENIMTEENQK
jgi:hypothetical protein